MLQGESETMWLSGAALKSLNESEAHMSVLRIASCMAENTESLCSAIATYLHYQLGEPTEYVTGIPWQEREAQFDRGEIQVLWLCGLPYVHKAELAESSMELLAVPVPLGKRYQGRPVYFSDVVVRRENPARCMDDLRGTVWAYNEPRSHSGFNVVRAYLADRREWNGFFTRVVEAGAHSRSLELILSGAVDGAAIDSMVLEWFGRRQTELMKRLRVVETIGPSPIPPWVISRRMPEELRARVRVALLRMHLDRNGRRILQRANFERFIEGRDGDYDPIRRMAARADHVLMA
jgi:phosphonate transport system substrate-binding protein